VGENKFGGEGDRGWVGRSFFLLRIVQREGMGEFAELADTTGTENVRSSRTKALNLREICGGSTSMDGHSNIKIIAVFPNIT